MLQPYCQSCNSDRLVCAPCLRHRCVIIIASPFLTGFTDSCLTSVIGMLLVCIWPYISQNYNYKLHFQNLSIYHIPNVSIGTLAAENLDVCNACDLWDSNIQLTMVKDRRPRPGMPFLYSDTCAEGGLFIFARVFFPVWCHPWMDDGTDGWTGHAMSSMDGWRDGWMEKASRPRRLSSVRAYTCVCYSRNCNSVSYHFFPCTQRLDSLCSTECPSDYTVIKAVLFPTN
jgi:hypothetical protein